MHGNVKESCSAVLNASQASYYMCISAQSIILPSNAKEQSIVLILHATIAGFFINVKLFDPNNNKLFQQFPNESRTTPRTIPERSPNDPQTAPERSPKDPRTTPKQFLNNPRKIPKKFRTIPERSPNDPVCT